MGNNNEKYLSDFNTKIKSRKSIVHHYGVHTRFAHVGRRKGIEWQGNQGSVRPLQERAQCIAATVMIIVEDFELSLIA